MCFEKWKKSPYEGGKEFRNRAAEGSAPQSDEAKPGHSEMITGGTEETIRRRSDR